MSQLFSGKDKQKIINASPNMPKACPSAKCEAFHVAPRLFFYVYVFDPIHEPATMPNLFPGIFYQWKNL